jgi:hypothetical protein
MVVTVTGMAAAGTAVGLADHTTARGAAAVVGMGGMAIEAVLALDDGSIGVAEIETGFESERQTVTPSDSPAQAQVLRLA